MAKRKDKAATDLVGLLDEWAPQIEKTLNQLATKGPKLVNSGRKMARSKGANVPKKQSGQARPSRATKGLVVAGGLGALLFMAVRRVVGSGSDWQVEPSLKDEPTDLS